MPELTIDKRQKEIQQFEITYNEMDKNYRSIEMKDIDLKMKLQKIIVNIKKSRLKN